MNIFANTNEFLGEIQPESLERSLSDLFNLADGIRKMLGGNQLLLSDYLEAVFDAICKTNIETSATLGFSNCVKELRTICGDIIANKAKYSQHPFYQTAKHYIDIHPLQYNDGLSKLEIYTVALIGRFYKYAAEQYYKEFKSKLECDGHIARIERLYNEICDILGTEEKMEKLNSVIKSSFMTIPVMDSFTQGIADNAALSLLYKELTSNTYVFDMPVAIEA